MAIRQTTCNLIVYPEKIWNGNVDATEMPKFMTIEEPVNGNVDFQKRSKEVGRKGADGQQ